MSGAENHRKKKTAKKERRAGNRHGPALFVPTANVGAPINFVNGAKIRTFSDIRKMKFF